LIVTTVTLKAPACNTFTTVIIPPTTRLIHIITASTASASRSDLLKNIRLIATNWRRLPKRSEAVRGHLREISLTFHHSLFFHSLIFFTLHCHLTKYFSVTIEAHSKADMIEPQIASAEKGSTVIVSELFSCMTFR
jgi:hypothetical protein